MFDLEKDPREEHDLSKETAHHEVLKTWRATLTERLAGRPEGFSDGKQLVLGRAYPPLHPLKPKSDR